MSQRNPVALLPADAPSNITTQQMTAAFDEAGSENVLVVLLTNNNGLGQADEDTYRTVVEQLRHNTADVVMIQEFSTVPALREVLTSTDGKAWILPIGLAGELGTPESYNAYTRVATSIRNAVDGSSLAVNLTGPAATVADLTEAGAQDRLPIELAIVVLLLVILVVIYRNPMTMMLPLITIGASLVTAQAIIAAVSVFTGLPISNQSIVLLSAMIAGAGTDYAVFLISRYHDYVRDDEDSSQELSLEQSLQAVTRALGSLGKVIAASAATVAVTFLGMGLAHLGLFSTTGVALAIGIAIAFLAAVTLLPAIMVVVGPRGWIKPRRVRTAIFWRKSGIRIVRRPAVYLSASLVVLIALALCVVAVNYNYDDRKALPDSMESSLGYAALDRYFSANEAIPQYLFISSPNDLRNPRALADLEQMAQRVSQLPGIGSVRGITRPTGQPLEEAKATFQAGEVGAQLGDTSAQIINRTGDISRLSSGADELADNLSNVRVQVNSAVSKVSSLVDALIYIQDNFGGGKTFAEIDNASRLVSGIRALGTALNVNFGSIATSFDWIDPVIIALDGSLYCTTNVVCSTAKNQFYKLRALRDDGTLTAISNLAGQLQRTEENQTITTTVQGLQRSLDTVVTSLQELGFGNPRTVRSQLISFRSGANDLASASRQIADGVHLLAGETQEVVGGLSKASEFLMAMGRDASEPSMAGFNIPDQILSTKNFQEVSRAFISPDGHAVRYLIQTDLNPFSTEAMNQVNTIIATAAGAQPNTTLEDATVAMSGYSVTLRDTRDYYNSDIKLIIIVTVLVVFAILVGLLRTVVAPLYLVGSVILSYLSAVGIGVIVFQFILGQQLHWSVPGLAFVVLVAVGADYNMLLASRLRDESLHGFRYGIIRTIRSTGGVITAAGLIFAASMFGLLFSRIGTVVQAGFVIGIGILLDTFIVRTITVPAMATLLGKLSWWPTAAAGKRVPAPSQPDVFDRVTAQQD